MITGMVKAGVKLPPSWADTPHNWVLAFYIKDAHRQRREWDEWDGTYEHGARIVDAQCERIEKFKRRANLTAG